MPRTSNRASYITGVMLMCKVRERNPNFVRIFAYTRNTYTYSFFLSLCLFFSPLSLSLSLLLSFPFSSSLSVHLTSAFASVLSPPSSLALSHRLVLLLLRPFPQRATRVAVARVSNGRRGCLSYTGIRNTVIPLPSSSSPRLAASHRLRHPTRAPTYPSRPLLFTVTSLASPLATPSPSPPSRPSLIISYRRTRINAATAVAANRARNPT